MEVKSKFNESLSAYAGRARAERVDKKKLFSKSPQVLGVSPVLSNSHNFLSEDKFLSIDEHEDRTDTDRRVYHYMSRLPLDEDGEHEFKSIHFAEHPVQTIAEYCKVLNYLLSLIMCVSLILLII